LAARQAAKIYKESKVWVAESKSIAEGFSALTMLDLNNEPEVILEEIQEVMNNVTTGLVTYAIRESHIDNLDIKKGEYIGLLNNKIVASNKRRIDVLKYLIDKGAGSDKEIVTIIYGADATQKEINDILKYIEKNYSNLEVEIIEGNQEVYSYILAIE
ncbi:MAG TPA: hypothetical protein VIK94_03060, partial [Bacilli bacterium]